MHIHKTISIISILSQQGMNSIIVYVGHKLVEEHFPFAVYNQENSHLTYLTANLVAVSLWMLIAFYWYSLRFFVKI